ncbi:MAG TPA: acylphosphatase [Phycisphaerales bacterium]|nr:acylphosphatase [Phycisphaerales bacterium]
MRLSITFRGRVQGVGFRFAAQEAVRRQAAPLTGWVRNEPDGSVLMEVQGEPAAIEAALAELHAAMGTKVQSQERLTLPESPGEQAFIISR